MHCPFPRFSQPSYAKAPERSELKTTGSNLSVRFSQYRQETRSSLGKQQLFLLSSTDGPLRPADHRPARTEKITCAAAWFTDWQCLISETAKMIVSGAAVNQTLASSRQMPDQFHLVSALLIKKMKNSWKKVGSSGQDSEPWRHFLISYCRNVRIRC